MANKRFIVIGAGGIGGALANLLAQTLQFSQHLSDDDRKLILVDGDSYEPRNLERQFFQDLGPKAEVKAKELDPLFPSVEILPLVKWVVEKAPENAGDEGEDGEDAIGVIPAVDLIQDGDVIFVVVDNFAARATVISAASKLNEVDVFLGGNDDRLYGSVYHYRRINGQDVTYNPLYKPELAEPTDRNPGEMSCQERAMIEGGTQLLAINTLVAATMLGKMHLVLFEEKTVGESDEILVDLEAGSLSVHSRLEDAPPAGVDDQTTNPVEAAPVAEPVG